jgi:prolyl-tRNA synthetase
VSPFHVHIIPIKYDGNVREVSDLIFKQLDSAGVEVLFDDRGERPGVKFMDADLIGIPFRVTVGEKGLKDGKVELFNRKTGDRELMKVKDAAVQLKKRIAEEIKIYEDMADEK